MDLLVDASLRLKQQVAEAVVIVADEGEDESAWDGKGAPVVMVRDERRRAVRNWRRDAIMMNEM